MFVVILIVIILIGWGVYTSKTKKKVQAQKIEQEVREIDVKLQEARNKEHDRICCSNMDLLAMANIISSDKIDTLEQRRYQLTGELTEYMRTKGLKKSREKQQVQAPQAIIKKESEKKIPWFAVGVASATLREEAAKRRKKEREEAQIRELTLKQLRKKEQEKWTH